MKDITHRPKVFIEVTAEVEDETVFQALGNAVREVLDKHGISFQEIDVSAGYEKIGAGMSIVTATGS